MDHVGAEIAEKLDFYTPITNFQMDQQLKLMSKMSYGWKRYILDLKILNLL